MNRLTSIPSSATPALTLAGLLTAAALVLGAGFWIARKEVLVRVPVDRQELRKLIEDLGMEVNRLDALYLQHLSNIARDTGFTSTEDLIRHCQQIEGIKLYSLLTGPLPEHALHYEVPASPPAPSESNVQPLGPLRVQAMARSVTDLARSRIFTATSGDSPHQGWEGVRGSGEAVYWEYKGPHMGIAFTLDVRAIKDSTEAYMRKWLAPRLRYFMNHGATLRIESPWQTALATPSELAEVEDEMPDIAAPIPGRWGHWQVMAWDRITPSTHLDGGILAGAGVMAASLALLGVMATRSQKRAYQLATQRVSFVNRVSHELATPLTNMLLNLDLARECLSRDPAAADRRLDLVEEETRRLSRLTDNVLTFSQASRGMLPYHPQPCVPDDLIRGVLSQFAPALTRAGLAVQTAYSASHPVLLDADAFVQIMANLISNVEKYASSGEFVEISTRWESDTLRVTVRDHGPGIPPAAAERIFQPFERLAHHTSEGTSGTGLGLAIARELAHTMGGTLHLDQPGQGSAFTLGLPAQAAA